MKILINAVSAKSGGAVTYLTNVVGELAERGWRHRYLVCLPTRVSKRMCWKWRNVEVIPTDVGFKSPWERFLWDQLSLRQIVKKERIDLLLSSSDFGLLFPPCRQILMIRNPVFFSRFYLQWVLPHKSFRFKINFFLRRRLVGLSIRHADIVMLASQSMLSDLRSFAFIPKEKKVIVNRFGVPLNRFRHVGEGRSSHGVFRLLFVSEYGDYKNLTTLLKAVLLLKEQGVNGFHLVTTASPDQFPLEESVTRRIDRVLVAHPLVSCSVQMTGPLPYEEIGRLYQRSDLFVFPSLAESFGHPLVEAMASGLPIIASDIPICREICGEAAVYFNPQAPRELAEKILIFRNNPALCQKLGELGRRRAEIHFSWKDHVQCLLKNFDFLMS